SREQVIAIRRHTKDVATLVQAKCRVPAGESCRIRIEMAGAQLRLWFESALRQELDVQSSASNSQRTAGSFAARPASEPLLIATDSQPLLMPGRLGVTAWGAAFSLDHLIIEHDGEREDIRGNDPGYGPCTRALEALCLLIFNLNEFIYVD